MPRAKKQPGRGGGQPVAEGKDNFGVEFVTIHLSPEDKDAIKAWQSTPEDVLLGIERLCDSGYKVSFSYDYYNTCFVFSLTGKKTCSDPENAMRCLVSRARNLIDAYHVAMYKLQVYCPDGTFPLSETARTIDFE